MGQAGGIGTKNAPAFFRRKPFDTNDLELFWVSLGFS